MVVFAKCLRFIDTRKLNVKHTYKEDIMLYMQYLRAGRPFKSFFLNNSNTRHGCRQQRVNLGLRWLQTWHHVLELGCTYGQRKLRMQRVRKL